MMTLINVIIIIDDAIMNAQTHCSKVEIILDQTGYMLWHCIIKLTYPRLVSFIVMAAVEPFRSSKHPRRFSRA